MLPPSAMLTIKNWVRSKSALFLAATLLLAACAPPGPRALLAGKRLLEQGKYPEAIEKFKTATVLLATNAPAGDAAQAWNYLGVAYHHAGQVAAAENAYLRALALNHDLTEAHYNLGCLWLEQNRFENAKGEFTTYALRRSSEPEGFIKLGLANLRASETGTPSVRARNLADAEKFFKEALKLNAQDPEALNGVGLARLYHSQPGEAVQYFSSALKAQPSFAPALLNWAVVAQSYLNQPQVAMEKYRAYLALKPLPSNAEAVRQALRQLEQGSGQPVRPAGAAGRSGAALTTPQSAEEAKAAEDTKPVEQGQPSSPAESNSTSAAATTLAETPAPKRSFLQRLFGHSNAPVAQPTPTVVTNLVAAAATNTLPSEEDLPPLPAQPGPRYSYKTPTKPTAGNHTEAEQAFTRAYQAQLGHHWSEAIKGYRNAIRIDPSYFDAYYNLSLAATASGELRTALTASEMAVTIKPEDARARYNFALALSQGNYLIDAANELEKLLAYAPTHADAHLALANLYAQPLRQPAKARAHYQRVLDLTPHCKQADAIRDWLVRNK